MYQQMIRQQLARSGYAGKYDPRHIEAFMRVVHSTLDGLSASEFDREVEVGRQCIDLGGAAEAEEVAQPLGL